MNRSIRSLRFAWILAATVATSVALACSSTPTVDDEVEPEKTEIELTAEETGMSIEALEAFAEGVALLEDDLAGAAEWLEKAVQMEPNFAEAHYNLGLVYGDMDRADQAVEHIQTARDLDPDVYDYTIAMAKAYAEAEEYVNARRLFNEVVNREPENLTAINNLAVISLREGNEEEALEYVEEILREDNTNVGALNTLGLIYMERENISLAQYVLGRALEQDETNADVLNNLGLVYQQEDDIPMAVRHFSQAIGHDANYLESRLNLGSILLEYLDYERAHEQFSRAVEIAPENCVANLGKGASSFALRNYEEAHSYYEYFLDHCDPDHIPSYERLAELNEGHMQRPAEAIHYYGKLVELETDEEKLERYEATINFLQNQLEQAEQVEPEPQEEAVDEGESDSDGE